MLLLSDKCLKLCGKLSPVLCRSGWEYIAVSLESFVFHNFEWPEVSGIHFSKLFICLPLSQRGYDRCCIIVEKCLSCFRSCASGYMRAWCLARQWRRPGASFRCGCMGVSDSGYTAPFTVAEAPAPSLSWSSLSLQRCRLTSATCTAGCCVFKWRWRLFVDPAVNYILIWKYCILLYWKKCNQILLRFQVWLFFLSFFLTNTSTSFNFSLFM